MNDRLTYEEKKELPDSMFGLPERREYPMPDAAHVRAAEAYFRYCPKNSSPHSQKRFSQRPDNTEWTWKARQCCHTPPNDIPISYAGMSRATSPLPSLHTRPNPLN